MRPIDVVLASALIGLAMGIVHTGVPGLGADAASPAKVAASDCSQSMCERVIWVRTPLMRAPTQVR